MKAEDNRKSTNVAQGSEKYFDICVTTNFIGGVYIELLAKI